MKKYISLFLSIALLAVLAGCAGDELSKADYDFTPDPAALPTAVTVTAGAGIFDATLTGSVTLGSDTVVLQKGFVVSTTADFATERIVPANAQTFRATVNNLESGSTYYAKAYVATHNGTAYSNATQFSTKVVTTILDVQSATSSFSDWETFYEACTFIDKDGDESEWLLTSYDEEGTQGALISYSWYGSLLEPENYLLLPAVTLNTGGIFIVTMEAADPDYPEEKVKLIISDAPITDVNCADAEVLAEHTLEDGEPYTFNADIPESYNNGNVYLGIAHYDCTDQYAVIVTGIKVVYVE